RMAIRLATRLRGDPTRALPAGELRRADADRAARGPVPARQAGGSVSQTVAALFVDPKGVYSEAAGVELWDEARDARLYAGPWPVVAHPPCNKWSRWAGFCEAVYGLKRGDDGGCFAAALAAVRRFGGVLEQPAYSKAWDEHGLPEPTWRGGWTAGL